VLSGDSGRGSLARAGAEFLDETKPPKNLNYFTESCPGVLLRLP